MLCCYLAGQNAGGPAGFVSKNYLGHSFKGCDLAFTTDLPGDRLDQALQRFNRTYLQARYGFESGWFSWLRYSARRLFRFAQAHKYPGLYFHDPASLYFCLDLIKATQFVFLHPHMPELLEEELVTMGASPDARIVNWARTCVSDQAFRRADVLVLPNQGVLPIYQPVANNAIVDYLPSGSAVEDPAHLGRIMLDPAQRHFLFIGRRERIKGFDEMIEGFRLARKLDQRLVLYIAGAGPALQGEDGVIDLGVLTHPLVWMRSVDAVVSVNRQSYFDRSVIEALGVGANLLISCTYGHRELAGSSSGIHDLGAPCPDAICRGLLHVAEHGYPAQSRADNISLYRQCYSDSVHRHLLEALLERYRSRLPQRERP